MRSRRRRFRPRGRPRERAGRRKEGYRYFHGYVADLVVKPGRSPSTSRERSLDEPWPSSPLLGKQRLSEEDGCSGPTHLDYRAHEQDVVDCGHGLDERDRSRLLDAGTSWAQTDQR
jgi:hypothetical protein